jgi:nucleotide-binding universal stress UspA family protein
MTTYLAGLDGSEASVRAATYAAQQAKNAGASLILAHAIEWSGFDVMGAEELPERHKIRGMEIERAQREIIQPVLQALSDEGLDLQPLIHHGHPAKTLLSLAEEHSVEHLFIGRHGKTRLALAIIGSITNSLIQASPIPITTVP